MKPDAWNMIAQTLNSITQLAADSKNAGKIARRCERVKRVLKGKPAEPTRRKRRRRRKEGSR